MKVEQKGSFTYCDQDWNKKIVSYAYRGYADLIIQRNLLSNSSQ